MARYRHYEYSQMIMVPVSLEEQLQPGTLEYAIHNVVEQRLDFSIFTIYKGISRATFSGCFIACFTILKKIRK
jgi:hypothetical protein